MKQINDKTFRAVGSNEFDFALRVVEQEYNRNDDCYLDKLSSHMRTAKAVGRKYLLASEDHQFLTEFLEALLEAAERPYVQATLDALLDAPLVTEDGEPADAESE